jgi:hypothetical protein
MDDELAQAARFEVEGRRAVWRGELRRAIELAQQITDRLGSGSELRPYRALWLYVAASWAAELVPESSDQADADRVRALRDDGEGTVRPEMRCTSQAWQASHHYWVEAQTRLGRA